MAIERTLAFVAEDLASSAYPESAKNPTVASIAKMVMTTMSSASVNHHRFFLSPLSIFRIQEVSGSMLDYFNWVSKGPFRFS